MEDPWPAGLKGQTGLTLQVHPDDPNDWGLRPSLPSDYLERLALGNERSGDDIKLEGLWRDSRSKGWHIATSQPARVRVPGSPPHPPEADIYNSLIAKGYVPVPRTRTLQNGTTVPDYKTWYHPETHLAVSDVKPNNFVQTAKGLFPVDLVLRDLHQPHNAETQALRDLMERRMGPRDKAQIRALLKIPEPPASPVAGQNPPGNLPAAPLHLRRSNRKGRPELYHLPDDVPATEKQRHGILNSAVNLYQSRFPALYRRFRKGTTEGRSGFECKFRDASGRITPASLKAALITVQEDKVVADTAGLSPRQTVFHVEQALGEEVRHLASLYAALALWEHSAKQQRQWQALEPWLVGCFSKMWHEDFSSLQRIAVLHAYAGNYGNPQRGNRMTYVPQDWQLALEGLRMFSQARAGTLPTEADQLWHWPKHSTYPLPQLLAEIQHAALGGRLSPGIEWMLRAMDELMRRWHAREKREVRAGPKAA